MTSLPLADLILADSASYLFRAFHALAPLTRATGQATGHGSLPRELARQLTECDRP